MQAALATAADAAVIEAQNADTAVRRMAAANLHLTLAFLGSVPLDRLPEVTEAAARCAQEVRVHGLPIEIVLDGLEHWRKAQVLVATTSDTPPAASALAEALKQSLVAAGFAPDPKPFRVHATLARKVRRATREARLPAVCWEFRSIHLVQSRTGPEGSTYTPVAEWRLLGDQPLP